MPYHNYLFTCLSSLADLEHLKAKGYVVVSLKPPEPRRGSRTEPVSMNHSGISEYLFALIPSASPSEQVHLRCIHGPGSEAQAVNMLDSVTLPKS